MLPISESLASGLLIIPILAFLILIHEFGHFFAARRVGVKVEEFGIGIPPRIRGWRRKDVLWSLNWIPFGGFVRVKGEDGTDVGEGSMLTKGPLQRAFFLVAGSTMNFLAAIVLSILIVGIQGIPKTDDSVYVGAVAPGSPAQTAGWLPGDAFVSVAGRDVGSAGALQEAITDNAGSTVPVTLRRGDERIETTITPRENPPQGQGATGIQIVAGEPSTLRVTQVDPGSVVDLAGWQAGDEIIAVNGVPIEAGVQATGLLASNVGNEVTVTIMRGGRTFDTTFTMPPQPIILSSVAAGSAASDAMLYPGDRITAIAGQPVSDALGFLSLLERSAGTTVPVEIVREGQPVSVELAIPEIPEGSNALEVIGANAREQTPYEALGADGVFARTYRDVPLTQVIPEGWNQFWAIVSGTVQGLNTMLTEGVDRDMVMGPVGMGQLTSESIALSATPPWVTLTMITIIISVGLGVLNLLPFPALDGGRLLFVLIEVLRGGRRISPEKEGLVHLAGMVVMLGLMFYIAFGDVDRLLDGRSIFP